MENGGGGGVRVGAVLGSAGLIYGGIIMSDPNIPGILWVNEAQAIEGSVVLSLAAGAAARKILNH